MPGLAGKRVVQISFRSRASSLLKIEQLRPETQKLVDALLALSGEVVPFFRDLHLAFDFDLEPQLLVLGMKHRGLMLGEADGPTFDRMVEGTPDLEHHWVGVPVLEPDLDRTETIVARWAEEQRSRGRGYTVTARREAITLSHRFLARSRMPRKALDLLSTVGALVEAGRDVDHGDVLDRFHQAYHVPRFLIDPAVPFDVDATERSFRARVLGQHEAVRTVVRMIGLIKAGLSDPRRPFGAFLFVGPTGVGKTHIAQLLAEYLFGGRDRMVRLNMADFGTPADAYTLFGNPDAYNPRGRRGLLTQRVSGHPFAVLLLDEFEKAHEKVHDRFLQLVDEGLFINGNGETVPCRSMILIATSNAGAEIYREKAIGFAGPRDLALLDRDLDRLLHRHFRFEFLNRFDEVVHFHPLGREEIRTIALREIEALRERSGLRGRGFQLEVDDAILDWLTAHGYDAHFGARFLRRTIERTVTTALAEAIVRERLPAGARLALGVRGGQVVARVVPHEEEARVAAVRLPEGTKEKVRTLDRAALVAEAAALRERSAPLAAALRERREEASALLAKTGTAGFWDDAAEAQRVLDRYRRLDVAIQAESRLAEPIERAAELGPRVAVTSLAAAVERAAACLADWLARAAEEDTGDAWLLLRSADPLAPAGEALSELASMYLAWCRRLSLQAEIVAVGAEGAAPTRMALEIEGPGTRTYLAMEGGIHRLGRPDGPDARVRVDVVPKSEWPREGTHRTSALKRRAAMLDVEIVWQGKAERDELGLTLELGGPSREPLEALLADLEARADLLASPCEVARVYGLGGTGARDPRTGAVVSRLREVLRGDLDVFLEAWRKGQRVVD
jgi:DNA polymerase III delta prime subunit